MQIPMKRIFNSPLYRCRKVIDVKIAALAKPIDSILASLGTRLLITNRTCAIGRGTTVYIGHVVEGRDTQFIVDDINYQNLRDGDER